MKSKSNFGINRTLRPETVNRLSEHVSEWELRVDDKRVFYDIDPEASLVRIVAIGYKEKNRLFFRGQEYQS